MNYMGLILLKLVLFNLFEEGFLLGVILLQHKEKELVSFKNLNVLVILSILSYSIQNMHYPIRIIRNFVGIVLYFIIIKIFYKYKNNKKLILSILLGFSIILILQTILSVPIILLFHFNGQTINTNILLNFLLLIPVYFVEFIMLVVIYNYQRKIK